MSERLQRCGTGTPRRYTSAPNRHAWRDCVRRFPGDERSRAIPESDGVGSGVRIIVSAGRGTWGAAVMEAGALLANQLRSTFFDDVGTLTKRTPTRPPESCQTTSPESLTRELCPGNANSK